MIIVLLLQGALMRFWMQFFVYPRKPFTHAAGKIYKSGRPNTDLHGPVPVAHQFRHDQLKLPGHLLRIR
jgi:hypothetical protein